MPDHDPFAETLDRATELCDRYNNRDDSFYGLAVCLRNRFDSEQVKADLDEAISFNQAALQLRPVGHPNRPSSLSELALCLQLKSESEGNPADLDQAISIHQNVLVLRPVGDPSRPYTLDRLASCFEIRFQAQRNVVDLENAVSRYREVLELRPVGHPHRAWTVDALAGCLRMRSEILRVPADLHESVFHYQAALELSPEGHSQRPITLSNLAHALETKFESERTAADLEQAISLHRDALKLRLVGDPFQYLTLDNLATCLKHRFDLHHAISDLDEAIDLRQTLLGSHSSADPQRYSYLSSLADCLEARYGLVGQLSDLEEATKMRCKLPHSHLSYHPRPVHHHSQIKRVIAGMIEQILETLPPRLLDTAEGVICDRRSQITKFESSLQYKKLLMSPRNRNIIQYSDIEDIRSKVAMFFRYATLSHRWGKGEPLLEHVEGRSVYLMSSEAEPQIAGPITWLDGLGKLQNFCRIAAEHGFLWAWSDTCCIDKRNSIIEVQEAIGSMFSWYRQSSLTIIYLADVSPNASLTDLSRSEWFRRGWTLQELLAPQAVLFYSRSWSLCMRNTSNHKQDDDILNELARITGIPSQYLTDFCPGMTDARLRLRWASSRRTTRPEDIAYSLFGIFDVHLPVLYGEGREKALGRLLQETISQSGDTSVLEWAGRPSPFHSCFPASIETYRFGLSLRPALDDTTFQRCLSRLQQLIDAVDAQRFYSSLTALPLPQFSNRRLLLPCIVHRIDTIVYQRMDLDDYEYEVRAMNLRPLVVTSSDQLRNSSHAGGLPYLIVRVLDQNLFMGLREGDSDAAYKVMVELDRPFNALLFEEVSFRTYRRIASSHIIVARIDESKRLADSEFRTLNVV